MLAATSVITEPTTMNSGLPGNLGAALGPKSVQEYIDETPMARWHCAADDADEQCTEWRIWTLAAAGKFFEGLVVFYDRCRDAAHF